MKTLWLLPFLAVGCAPSSARFVTKYTPDDSLVMALERGAPSVGCHSETSFHGEQIQCADEKSVNLIENGNGHYEAECVHMHRSECEELLQKMFDAGKNGS